MVALADLDRCFHGIVPASISTCSADGTPNVTYLSQVHYVDARHVALSCQFFNKTRRNVAENPYASVQVHDPLTLQAYELELEYEHSETSGPLFEEMSLRIEAIASHTGMTGIFRLLSADVYEVTAVREITEFLERTPIQVGFAEDDPDPPSIRTEMRALQRICNRLSRVTELAALLPSLLAALDEELGFEYSMVLVPDESGERLYAIESHGYGEAGIGAEVPMGEGLIGAVAKERKLLRLSSTDTDLRYARAIRESAQEKGTHAALEIPLPGLPNAQSRLVIPLVTKDRLVGVLSVESPDPLAFREWHESLLNVIASQAATAIDQMERRDEVDDTAPSPAPGRAALVKETRKTADRVRRFCFYRADECVFVDGDYLIRNVPAKILRKILRQYLDSQRTEFSNRELRMDASLGLPPVKDNLESRLILLRKRLAQKCPDIRLVSAARGHFRLEVDAAIEYDERDTP